MSGEKALERGGPEAEPCLVGRGSWWGRVEGMSTQRAGIGFRSKWGQVVRLQVAGDGDQEGLQGEFGQ